MKRKPVEKKPHPGGENLKLGPAYAGAARLGISIEEYRAKCDSGLRWCSIGKHWQSRDRFGPSGMKSAKCRKCLSEKLKKYNYSCPYDPKKDPARNAVRRAVKKGILPPNNETPCARCGHIGKDRQHHYHHHRGYSKKFRLDVVLLCGICHGEERRG